MNLLEWSLYIMSKTISYRLPHSWKTNRNKQLTQGCAFQISKFIYYWSTNLINLFKYQYSINNNNIIIHECRVDPAVRALAFHQIVAKVRYPYLPSYVDWVSWFSTLIWEVFTQALQFFPLLKNQHLICFDLI